MNVEDKVKSDAAKESWQSRLLRWRFNMFPAYRRTGGRITFIDAGLHRIRVRIPLNWKTRNYVGTIFGGSMYGAVDPIYMVMFIRLLGPGYIVWDKAARIEYKKPGRSTLTAEFEVTEGELQSIRDALERTEKIERTYRVELRDGDGVVCAAVEKLLYFRRK
jgi:acyl-coenzyme A thioesterase PaaI-like protein